MDPRTELADWAAKRKRDPSILVRELQKDIIASPLIADPAFGQKKSIYTDFFASSKPLKRFETIMMEKVLPFYANTHTSTTSTSKCTSSSVKKARETVARCTNAISTVGHQHQAAVIFSGDGSTSAINKIRNVFRLGDEAYWIRRVPQDTIDLNLRTLADESSSKQPIHCAPTSISFANNPKQQSHPATCSSPSCFLPDQYRPVVFISIQEHHSNLLPWRESCADVIVVPETSCGELDLVFLEEQLIQHQHRPLKLGSFSAGSNLTGVLNDTVAISELLHKYGAFAFYDYAGVGPYTTVDMNPAPSCVSSAPNTPNLAYKDGVFLSIHKFLGGPGASGILVARLEVFSWTEKNRGPSLRSVSPSSKSGSRSSTGTSMSVTSKSSLSLSSLSSVDSMDKSEWLPTNPGGGTVDMVIQGRHKYTNNILAREEAGTPNILATIRTGLVFSLQEIIRPTFVLQEEYRLAKKVLARLLDPALDGAINVLGNPSADRVAVFSLTIAVPRNVTIRDDGGEGLRLQIHYALLSTLMNDFFGIEMRGGCMCAGPYASQLLKFDAEKEIKFWNLLLGKDLPRHTNTLDVEENGHSTLSSDTVSYGDRERKTNIHQQDLCSKSLKPGFVRFSFSYFTKDKDVDFVIRSLEWMARYGYLLVPLYKVDASSGEWSVRPAVRRAVLAEISPKRLRNASRESCIPVAVDCIRALARLFQDQHATQQGLEVNGAESTMHQPNDSTALDPNAMEDTSDVGPHTFQSRLQPNSRGRTSTRLSNSVRQAKRSVSSVFSNVRSMASTISIPSFAASTRMDRGHPVSSEYLASPFNVTVPSLENIAEHSHADLTSLNGNDSARFPSSIGLPYCNLPTSSSDLSSLNSEIDANNHHKKGYPHPSSQALATPPTTPPPSGPYSFAGAQPSTFTIGTSKGIRPSVTKDTAVSATTVPPGGSFAARKTRPKDPQIWASALQELGWDKLEQELKSIETSPLTKELRWFVTPLEVARVYAREVEAVSSLS
ncbi:hypothetical protein EMPS_01136 [Entomortierella parvispora]|uniref:Aminotransferase class V domain-containing protein n=1 Tax=Entomortierella parvispora TaxID=205924 RepID=A0A9P3H2A8_9FUNG|nr:hypothetical protein EMPS_01136 [Entomortierella parvispora]